MPATTQQLPNPMGLTALRGAVVMPRHPKYFLPGPCEQCVVGYGMVLLQCFAAGCGLGTTTDFRYITEAIEAPATLAPDSAQGRRDRRAEGVRDPRRHPAGIDRVG
jgi:hypothetical protein